MIKLHKLHKLFKISGGVVTTLMLTSLYLILDALTLPDVGCFKTNHKMLFTFGALELLVLSPVAVEGPGPGHRQSTLLAGALLGVQVGLLLVPAELLVAVALLRTQVTHEDLLLLHLDLVKVKIHIMLHALLIH